MYWTLLLIETIHETENFVKVYESFIKVIRKMYTVHFLPLMIYAGLVKRSVGLWD